MNTSNPFVFARRLFLVIILTSIFQCLYAQNDTFNNVPPLSGGGNTAGGNAFNFTTNQSITVLYLRGSFSAVSGTVNVWYNPVKINGQPSITTANGWVNLGSAAMTGVSPSTTSPVVQTVPVPLSLVMNAGDTFGFMIQWTGNVYPTTNTTIPTFSNGTVTIIADPTCAYTANPTMATWFTPRQINGGVIYKLNNKAPNNAGISALVSPTQFCAGYQDLKVKLKNYGRNVLTNVTVNWKLNGTLQSPISWTGSLDTIGGAMASDTFITLTNMLFATGVAHNVKAWTEYPNSFSDTMNTDDTLTVVIKPSLGGTYTIGGTTPDYPNFTSAVADLNAFGVCSPVIFNVAAGTFTERITLNKIPGVSSTNTISFMGAGKTSTTLTYAGTSTADFATVLLNGTDYVTFRDMTIGASNVTNGVGILLTDEADNNRFRNLRIQMNVTSTATTASGVSVTGSATSTGSAGNGGNYNIFDSLDIDGAYYGVRFYGTSSTDFIQGNVISNCVFTNQYYYGISSYYHSGFNFNNNKINQLRIASAYCIQNYYGSNYTINANNMQSPSVGLYNYYSNNYLYNSAVKTVISNNMISATASYGIYFTTSNNVKMVHNTVLVSGTTAAVYFTSGTNFNFRNNIVVSTSTGANSVMYIAAAITFDSLDYNNYYSYGTGFVTGGTAYASLAAWKTSVPAYNMNSLSINPLLSSVSNLHLQPASPVMFGVSAGIPVDMDGQIRLLPPTMGADERNRIANNAGVTELKSPVGFCAGVNTVKVNVINHGNNVINNVQVNWELDGVLQTPLYWSGFIDTLGGAGKNDTILTLGTASFTANVSRTIKAWTSNPNFANDSFNYDDTIFVSLKSSLTGTYSVGPTGTYPTLTAAMADMQINVCGPVILELQSNYTSANETFPIVINPAGLTAINKLIIRPQTGATAINISSAVVPTTIDLNGSRYVTIDGRPGGTGNKVLSIVNLSTTGSAVRFINDAQNNKLSNVSMVATNSSATSGVVFFSTTSKGTTASNGNNNNLIDSCNINGNSASMSCIYSQGSTAPADNKSNTITNCNIYDFFSNVASANASGVSLQAGNSLWNIGTTGNGNKFYQTNARTPLTVPALTNVVAFKAVFINDASVNGTNIIGNRIGGNIPGIVGSTFVIGSTGTTAAQTLRVIDNYVSGTTYPTSIQGNTISDITFYSTASNSFVGIQGRSGFVNTGNIAGNILGSSSGTGSLIINHVSTTTVAKYHGIRYESANGTIENNVIGAITAEAQNATGNMQFICINVTGTFASSLTVSQNTIGSAGTSNSVQGTAASLGAVDLFGIIAEAVNGAPVIIANNTIANFSSLSTLANTRNGAKGIYVTGASSSPITIAGNSINNFYSVSNNPSTDRLAALVGINSSTSGTGKQIIANNMVYALNSNVTSSTAVSVTGINYESTTTASGNTVEKNRVFSLVTANPLAVQNGLLIGGAGTSRVTVANNMIHLGYDFSGASLTGSYPMNGILKSGGLASFVFNTVRMGGTGVGSNASNTFAFRSNTTTSDSLMNNLFLNTRTNATTGGTHYAIGLMSAVNLATNYNLYYTTVTPLGLFNSVNQSNLAAWKSATGQDLNSVSTLVNFISLTDLHLTGTSIGNVTLTGKSIPGVNTDFDGQIRPVYPYMGADENTSFPLPVKLLNLSAKIISEDVLISWSTSSEINASHFIVEASADGKKFKQVGTLKAKGNSAGIVNYELKHIRAFESMDGTSIIYYRLTSVDADGSALVSGTVLVHLDKTLGGALIIYPNPFNDELFIHVNASDDVEALVVVSDLSGKTLLTQTTLIKRGDNLINVDKLQSFADGMYLLNVEINGKQTVQKILKYAKH